MKQPTHVLLAQTALHKTSKTPLEFVSCCSLILGGDILLALVITIDVVAGCYRLPSTMYNTAMSCHYMIRYGILFATEDTWRLFVPQYHKGMIYPPNREIVTYVTLLMYWCPNNIILFAKPEHVLTVRVVVNGRLYIEHFSVRKSFLRVQNISIACFERLTLP